MKSILIFILTITLSYEAQAKYSITPMVNQLSEKIKTASYTLTNESNETGSYQAKVFKREIDKQGNDILTPTKELRIFPSKIVVKPGQKKRVKAQYLGKKNINLEKSYRVVFEQVEVDKLQSKKTTNTFIQFITSLYVTPKGVEPKIIFDVHHEAEKGETLQIKNTGGKHLVLQNWGLTFKLKNGEQKKHSQIMPDINMLANSQAEIALDKINIDINDVVNISMHQL